jgi:hypothetical protein
MSLNRLRLSALRPKNGTNKPHHCMITPSKVKFYTLRDKVDSRALLLLFFQVRKKVKMLTAFLCLSKGIKSYRLERMRKKYFKIADDIASAGC